MLIRYYAPLKYRTYGGEQRNITSPICRYQEEIRILNLQNVCCHSIQNLLSKNVKLKTCRYVILPTVLHGCETWSLTLREEQRLSVSENRVLRGKVWAYDGGSARCLKKMDNFII
jgi:hypothetical protein